MMIDYKWCVCDMDGTLLNSKDIISEENKQALKKLQEKGLEVIIASGRVDLMVKRYIKELDLKGHVISCNGGLIRNIKTGKVIYSRPIEGGDARKIIDYSIKNEIDFLIYTDNLVYSNKNNPRALKFHNLNRTLEKNLKVPIKYIDDIDIEGFKDLNILKILLVCNNQKQVELLKNRFYKVDSLTVVSSADGLLDIMASNISKGKALKILSQELNINLDEVMAFGDNYNDIEMFECVGMPVAMGNSVEKLKAKAKYITKSNDESGIAYAINNYINI